MIRNRLLLLLVIATVIHVPSTWAESKDYTIDPQNSHIGFSFRSTLHGVEGEAGEFSGSFSPEPNGDGLSKGQVVVKTSSLNTFHEKRDRNMFDMFNVADFPEITYEIHSIHPVEGRVSPSQVELDGDLVIKDVKLPVIVLADVVSSEQGLSLSGETQLSLRDFQLKPPSVLGLIRVFDTVTVHFETLLVRR